MRSFDDTSDIPVINEEPIFRPPGFMEDDNDPPPFELPKDLDAETASVMRELESEEPLEEQKRFQASGGWLAPKRSKMPMPDKAMAGKRVRLIKFDENGSETQLADYTVDGMNDPLVRAVFKKHALTSEDESRSFEDYSRVMTQAMREVQAAKSRKPTQQKPAPPSQQSTNRAESPQPQNPQPGRTTMPQPRVDVVFKFGGIDGQRRARYSDAYVHDTLLVLVADEAMVNSGVYEPPDLGPNSKFEIDVSNMSEPLVVFSCGLSHSYDGKMFYLLFVDR